MNFVSIFYPVFFFVISGQPVVITPENYTPKKEVVYFSSKKECLEFAQERLDYFFYVTSKEVETTGTAFCMPRIFNELGEP